MNRFKKMMLYDFRGSDFLAGRLQEFRGKGCLNIFLETVLL